MIQQAVVQALHHFIFDSIGYLNFFDDTHIATIQPGVGDHLPATKSAFQLTTGGCVALAIIMQEINFLQHCGTKPTITASVDSPIVSASTIGLGLSQCGQRESIGCFRSTLPSFIFLMSAMGPTKCCFD